LRNLDPLGIDYRVVGKARVILRDRSKRRPLRWSIALAGDEASAILDAALAEGMTGSRWARETILRAAKKRLGKRPR
jgi:hypothetical protein